MDGNYVEFVSVRKRIIQFFSQFKKN